MARPATVPAASLIEAGDFYPRAHVDDTHVSDIVHALAANVSLPPVIADRRTRRLVDGWHRRRAVLKHFGPDATIEVFWRDYADESAMYAEAVQLNASHGRKFSSWDRTRITLRCQELDMPLSQVAVLLHKPEEVVEKLTLRVAETSNGETVALKRPLRRLAGTTLTESQEQMNLRSSGWTVGYHAAQLIGHIEAETVDYTSDLVAALSHLRDLLVALDLT